MAKIKLTKSAVDAAEVTSKDYELRDTIVPGFLCKVTAHGRKVFMLQYRTNWGERRKPKIGQFGELTVEQARSIAQDWLADVRKGSDPSSIGIEQGRDVVPVHFDGVPAEPLEAALVRVEIMLQHGGIALAQAVDVNRGAEI